MKIHPTPEWAFMLYCEGLGDLICADDLDLPIHPLRRIFYRVRGEILYFLFGWWWYE